MQLPCNLTPCCSGASGTLHLTPCCSGARGTLHRLPHSSWLLDSEVNYCYMVIFLQSKFCALAQTKHFPREKRSWLAGEVMKGLRNELLSWGKVCTKNSWFCSKFPANIFPYRPHSTQLYQHIIMWRQCHERYGDNTIIMPCYRVCSWIMCIWASILLWTQPIFRTDNVYIWGRAMSYVMHISSDCRLHFLEWALALLYITKLGLSISP